MLPAGFPCTAAVPTRHLLLAAAQVSPARSSLFAAVLHAARAPPRPAPRRCTASGTAALWTSCMRCGRGATRRRSWQSWGEGLEGAGAGGGGGRGAPREGVCRRRCHATWPYAAALAVLGWQGWPRTSCRTARKLGGGGCGRAAAPFRPCPCVSAQRSPPAALHTPTPVAGGLPDRFHPPPPASCPRSCTAPTWRQTTLTPMSWASCRWAGPAGAAAAHLAGSSPERPLAACPLPARAGQWRRCAFTTVH